MKNLTHRGLGIRTLTNQGFLKMAYRVPKTGELFLLREKRGILSKNLPFGTLANMKLKLLRHEKGKEKMVGKANYYPMERDILLGYIWTEPPYRKRDVAASLISYILRTHGKPVAAEPTRESAGFYKELGFTESKHRQLAVEISPERLKRKFYIGMKK